MCNYHILQACAMETTIAHLGVVNRHGRTNAQFVAFMALINHSEAKICRVVYHLWHRDDTNHSLRHADIERSGVFFCGQRQQQNTHACTRGNYVQVVVTKSNSSPSTTAYFLYTCLQKHTPKHKQICKQLHTHTYIPAVVLLHHSFLWLV